MSPIPPLSPSETSAASSSPNIRTQLDTLIDSLPGDPESIDLRLKLTRIKAQAVSSTATLRSALEAAKITDAFTRAAASSTDTGVRKLGEAVSQPAANTAPILTPTTSNEASDNPEAASMAAALPDTSEQATATPTTTEVTDPTTTPTPATTPTPTPTKAEVLANKIQALRGEIDSSTSMLPPIGKYLQLWGLEFKKWISETMGWIDEVKQYLPLNQEEQDYLSGFKYIGAEGNDAQGGIVFGDSRTIDPNTLNKIKGFDEDPLAVDQQKGFVYYRVSDLQTESSMLGKLAPQGILRLSSAGKMFYYPIENASRLSSFAHTDLREAEKKKEFYLIDTPFTSENFPSLTQEAIKKLLFGNMAQNMKQAAKDAVGGVFSSEG